jgi:hypothetical protein
MRSLISWEQIRPWKTPLTVSRQIQVTCDHLMAEGVEPGALLYALLLAIYDVASAPSAFLGAHLIFRNLEEFGTDGLAGLPQSGASSAAPVWDGVTDRERCGLNVHQELGCQCSALERAGVSHHDVTEGLLMCARNILDGCDEASRRYWLRQFRDFGAQGRAVSMSDN